MSLAGRRSLLLGACLLTALSVAALLERLDHTGLALEVREEDGSQVASYAHASLGPTRLDAILAREARTVRSEWTGYWEVPAPGFSELVLKSDGEAVVDLDGETVLGVGADPTQTPRLVRHVAPGSHRLHVVYWSRSGSTREILLKGITAGGRSIAADRDRTFATEPGTLDFVMGWSARLLPVLSLLAWSVLIAFKSREGEGRDLLARAPALLIVLVTLLAAVLRFEAVVTRYWGVSAPDWAEALAGEIRSLRPGAFEHAPTPHPYEGDPFSYLTIARTMGAFFEPSAREPLFPELARIGLYLSGGSDIGINFVSAISSTLVCVAIFALGSRLLSKWTGLFAAFLWAIEWQTISFSVEGWRDDLFTLQVTACAAALVSLQLKPSRRTATILGVIGGLTLLTRLSALTFLAPGLLAAVLLPSSAPRRARARAAFVALLWMSLLAGPFMAACALGYDDPFYAVNVHAAFYRHGAGLPGGGRSTALQFLVESLMPWDFLRTGFVGLTSYPFENKWFGLGALFPGLGIVASALALAGLPILLWRPGGLVALIVLFSSIVPYAWTWAIPGGSEWRFTLPAYPFYLVSAAVALETGIRGLQGFVFIVRKAESRRPALIVALRLVVTGVLLATSFYGVSRRLEWQRANESLRLGRSTLIEAGEPSRLFFTSGWKVVENTDGSPAVSMIGAEARIRLPLPDEVGAHLVMRLEFVPGTPSAVEVFAGGEPLGSFSGARARGESAAIDLLPRHERQQGVVELRFARLNGDPGLLPLSLLWVRVEPSGPPLPQQ